MQDEKRISSQVYSTSQWSGLKSQKFKGGRKHDNHPRDQLDNLLLGAVETQIKYLGPTKRRINESQAIAHIQQPKPHLRTIWKKNQSNIVFSSEQIPKLIKIPPSDNFKQSNSLLFRTNKLGQSKLKNLQKGLLKTGIYRQFYKSQQNHQKNA